MSALTPALHVKPSFQSVSTGQPSGHHLSSFEQIKAALLDLDTACWVVNDHGSLAIATASSAAPEPSDVPVLANVPAWTPADLGDPAFKEAYGLRYAMMAGAMANAIASEQMIIALAHAGFLGSFGAAGLPPARLETAIHTIQKALPNGPYAFNLINSPNEPALEQRAVELYLKHGIHVIEASAYLDMTINLVLFRAAGLSATADGSIQMANRIIAKLSRKEVARRFMQPAPPDILKTLLEQGRITPLQAELAARVPMADDITVEADSGGHTDNRPLVNLLPTMIALRDELQDVYGYAQPIRIGAAGGISTPEAALAAFMMGAAYVVTGSVNQACIESGASDHTRRLLAQADMADVTMAPSSDMFEMGVKVQVLKRGTMFAARAAKLYELYSRYPSLEAIPAEERQKLETQIFKRDLVSIWEDTVRFFQERDPRQIERANQDPHMKMALVFRWYLGLSSRWSNTGEKGREMDYQIWCGPSMGSFNDWVRGTYLEQPDNRRVADVNLHILRGAAYLHRLRALEVHGIQTAPALHRYKPLEPASA